MLRRLLERPGQPQHLVCAFARGGLDRHQACAAHGQRAGLVEHHGVGVRQRLERSAALDEDAAPRGLGHAGDEGDRCRQDERAGRCRDQHGEAPDRIAGEEPGGTGQDQRDRQQQQGVAVGQADERSLRGLGRRHHSDDAGIGALAGGCCGAQLERLAGVEGAAPRGLPGPAADRDRLARQRRLVDQGLGARDHPIDGDDLARAHE